jgi:hypothetical protein
MPQHNTEGSEYKVLKATKWSRGDKIDSPIRIVLLELKKKEVHGRYVIRYQLKKGTTFGGEAVNTLEDGNHEFLQAIVRHNKSFGPRNIAHLPGIEKKK